MNSPQSLVRLAIVALLLMTMQLCILSVGGCVAAGQTTGRKPLPSQPKALDVGIVEAYPSVPIDTDKNGYVDTIEVTAFLFPDRFKHPAPLWIKGQFIFRMTDPDGNLLAQWEFTEEETARARRVFPVGRGHWFRLNMLDVGTDRTDVKSAALSCKFVPTNGDVVEMARKTSFRLGAG